jgi:hypothetical protein
VQNTDALLLAVYWSRLDDVVSQAGDPSGKVIASGSLPMNADDSGPGLAYRFERLGDPAA